MTTIHRSDAMTDTLRAAAQAVLDRWDSLDWKAAPTADYMNRLRAALAAAPQPAPEEGLTRAQVGAMLDAKRLDREALVQVIVQAMLGRVVGLHMAEAIADALLARGRRLPGEETMAWAVIDKHGRIDPHTIYPDEWMADRKVDPGERIARVAIRVVEGGDDDAA